MADTKCALGRLDPAALAWAGGFFDGEGSTFIYEPRPDYLQLTSRKICNACSRMRHRMKRAAQGIKPRQFKNVARRYTS